MRIYTSTWQHLLHVDLALLEQVREPLFILQLGCLLQAKQEKREVYTVLQRMGQVCDAQEVSDNGTRSKLGQIRFHQGNVTLKLRALVQNVKKSLQQDAQKLP